MIGGEFKKIRSPISKYRERSRFIFRNENATLGIVLVALIVGFGVLTKGYTVTASNITNIIVQSSIRGVAAVGQAFVILTSGIDVSIGGIALVTLCLGGFMMTGTTGFPAGSVALMLVVGMAIGATTGLSVSRVNMPPLVITLAVWGILRGVSLQITKGHTLIGFPDEVAFFGQGTIAGAPLPIIIFLAVAAVAYFVLNHTTFGKSVYAVGGSPTGAWLSGIGVSSTTFSVYVISGFCGALAGLITLSRTMAAGVGFAYNIELDSIASVVIGGVSLAGGRGNIIGVVIGALIIGVINNAMSVMAAGPGIQDIVKGAIIIGAVATDYLRRR
jgi:ribose/xylose/arabinose/galactoside ABC-type transport system permease subunit